MATASFLSGSDTAGGVHERGAPAGRVYPGCVGGCIRVYEGVYTALLPYALFYVFPHRFLRTVLCFMRKLTLCKEGMR